MFDIAWSELLVIIVVALVVVGPKDLPRLMRTAGQWAGRARAMADQFRRSFDDIARQSELDELRAEVNKLQQAPMAEIESAMYPGTNFNLNSSMDDVSVAPAPEPAPSVEPPPSSSSVPQALPETPETPART
jgi:sec-independent protein translocase protein TatB